MSRPQTDERAGLTSASKVELEMNCPGCRRIIAKAPPEEPNEFQASGVRVHAALAGDDVALTADEMTVTLSCQRLETQYAGPIWNAHPGPKRIVSEKRFFLHGNDGRPLMSCKPDRFIYVPPVLIVEDYKTGRLPVTPARDNWQMKSEAVIAAEVFDFEEVWLAIFQPWVHPQISETKLTREDIPAVREILIAGLKRAEDPNAPLIAGDHCRFCPGRLICPEVNRKTLAPIDWKDASLTGEELGRRLRAFPVVESVVAEHRDLAKKFLAAHPDSIPGWELHPGVEVETIGNSLEAFGALAEWVTAEEFLACCRVSVDALREMYAKKRGVSFEQAKADLPRILGASMRKQRNEPFLKQTRK